MSKLSNRAVVTISVLCILIGLLLVSSDYLKSKKEKAYEKVRISLLVKDEKQKVKDNTPKKVDEEPETPVEPLPNGYIGILTIEKINLEQGFYDKGNPENDVDRNITFLEPTNYPDEKNGNVILVSHSGSSSIAYFKHLYQLEVGDIATIRYNGKLYTYKIDDIYTETKDGDVTIYRDTTRNTLTMITCTKDDDTKQTVYISYLQKVE